MFFEEVYTAQRDHKFSPQEIPFSSITWRNSSLGASSAKRQVYLRQGLLHRLGLFLVCIFSSQAVYMFKKTSPELLIAVYYNLKQGIQQIFAGQPKHLDASTLASKGTYLRLLNAQGQIYFSNHIINNMLECLPLELFLEVASYLTFIDKKAVSIASRRCHSMTGRFGCPNQLTWLIHLCRSPARFHEPLSENPKVFRDLIFSVHSYLVYKYGKMIALQMDIEELVSPYFPKTYPESMLVHYYMTVAHDFVKSAIQCSDAAGLDTAPLTPRYFWGRIESETAYVIEWLERQKPTEVNCCKAVSHASYSRIDICKRRA